MEDAIDIKPMDPPEVPGDITFTTGNNVEVLKLCADGRILVKGKEITNDMEVVAGMREFLTSWRNGR